MENEVNVRLILKHDELEEWVKNDPILKDGELVVVAVQAEANTPSIMTKVGNGKYKFSELDYTYAKAADVYEWAKKSALEYNDLPSELLTKIEALENSTAEKITNDELEEILI